MQPLSSTSQRRSIAPKFAAELRKAIRARQGSVKRVCEATHVPRSNLGYYLAGRNLPTIYEVVKAEIDDARASGGPVRRAALEVGLAVYVRSDSKRHEKFTRAQRRIDGYAEAIDTMCRTCEPEGLCRDDGCPLRAFSPLPLAGSYTENRPSGQLRRAGNSWDPTNRPKTLAAIQAAAEERWSRPGERERMAEITRARWDAMSPAQRAAAGEAISVARRAS